VLTGLVKDLAEYGAIVDLGGPEGLLHITDMSWGRLCHPRDIVQIGDRIRVKVLKLDKEKRRVSLGFKQLTRDPWLDAAERYPLGARVTGRVISVTDYGAFMELEPGVEGLVHVSEMTWSKTMRHPSRIVNVGDRVQAVVLSTNALERRISLGMRQLAPPPKPVTQVAAPVLPPAKRNIPTAPSVTTPEDFDYHTLLEWTGSLEKLRALLIRLLDEIEPLPTGVDMKPTKRLGELVREGKIPRTIAPMLQTLIELRNDNHYKSNVPGPNEISVITAILTAVIAWAVKNHLKTASGLRLWTLPDCS
jgi:predicted RNA-binding protein with RPS1 domain